MKGLHTKAIVLFNINVLNKNTFTTHYIKTCDSMAWPDIYEKHFWEHNSTFQFKYAWIKVYSGSFVSAH